jgi:hypothetical protein
MRELVARDDRMSRESRHALGLPLLIRLSYGWMQ